MGFHPGSALMADKTKLPTNVTQWVHTVGVHTVGEYKILLHSRKQFMLQHKSPPPPQPWESEDCYLWAGIMG